MVSPRGCATRSGKRIFVPAPSQVELRDASSLRASKYAVSPRKDILPEHLETIPLAFARSSCLPNSVVANGGEKYCSKDGICAQQLSRMSHRLNSRRPLVTALLEQNPTVFHKKRASGDTENVALFLDNAARYRLDYHDRKGMTVPKFARSGHYSNPTTFPAPGSRKSSSSPQFPLGSSFSDSLSYISTRSSSRVSSRNSSRNSVSSSHHGSIGSSGMVSSFEISVRRQAAMGTCNVGAAFNSHCRPLSAPRGRATRSETPLSEYDNYVIDIPEDCSGHSVDDFPVSMKVPPSANSSFFPRSGSAAARRPRSMEEVMQLSRRLASSLKSVNAKSGRQSSLGDDRNRTGISDLHDPIRQIAELNAFDDRLRRQRTRGSNLLN